MRFEIEPKIGLGNFILGMNINQVLSLIKRNGYYYKHCKIISNKDKNTPIFLHLPSELITLRFNYYTQNLELIEKKILVENNIEKNSDIINDDTEYYYKNKLFFVQNKNKEFHIIKYQNIAQLFGLSKVPKKLNKNKNIFLEYSGIGFYFTNIVLDPEKNEDLDISADPSSVDTNSVLSKFFIFREDSLYDSLNKKNIFNENNVEIKYDSKKAKSISIKNLETNNKSVIKIGDNIDDVLKELKNPNYIYYSNDKNDNYNQVQNNGDTLYNQATNKIFYLNYFNYGFDIMICNNKVNRIILHTNQIGDSKFGIYERCNFKLKLRKEYLNSLIGIENKINDKEEENNIKKEIIKDKNKNETNLRKESSQDEKKKINDNKNEEKKSKIEIKKEENNKPIKNKESNIKEEKAKNDIIINKEKSIENDDNKEKKDKDINIKNKINDIKEIHQIKNINDDINNDAKKEIKKEDKKDEKDKLINLDDNAKDAKENTDDIKKEIDSQKKKDDKEQEKPNNNIDENKKEELSNENIVPKKDDLNIENNQKENNNIEDKSNKESEDKKRKEEKNDEVSKKEEEGEDEKKEVKENEEEKKEEEKKEEEKKEEEKKEEEKNEEENKSNENKISQKNNNYSNKNNRKRRKKHGNPPKKKQKISSEEEDESDENSEKDKNNEKRKEENNKDESIMIFPWSDFKEEFLSKIQYNKNLRHQKWDEGTSKIINCYFFNGLLFEIVDKNIIGTVIIY